MASITRFLEKRLRLKVNREKSAVGQTVGEEVPRLFDDVAQETKIEGSARIGTETQRPHPGTVAERPGTGSRTGHRTN